MNPGNKNLEARPLRLLLVGPLPPPSGGTRVSFQLLVDYLTAQSDLTVGVVADPALRGRGPAVFFSFLGQMVLVMLRAPFVDVLSLHCNPSALPFKGLLLLALAKLFRKGLVIRTFGGDRFLERGTPWRRAINRFILRRSDIYLAQTQEQQRLCLELGIPHPQWFPTSRPLPAFAREGMERPGTCRRFVFAGHVRQAKGIGEILEAGERFDSSVGIDVYGQLDEDFPEERFHSCHRVRYCGHIPYHQVPEVLTQYGALLLPTYHWGEGYPGIIIEAFQAGLPVICTRWLALPELVGDDCGILIKPQDAGELHDAMKRLVEDDPLYLRLCEGALRKGGEFSSELWAGRFVEYCRQAARKRAPST